MSTFWHMEKLFSCSTINALFHALGKDRSLALPMFHSFKGCDTVSAFYGKGKRLAWRARKYFSEVTEAFAYLAQYPFTLLDFKKTNFKLIERFTVVLYDKTSQLNSVNSAREDIFCHKARAMD